MTYSEYASQFIGVKQGSARHKKVIDTYNTIKPLPRGYRVKYTDNWCATFVSFVLKQCRCKRKIYECGAERMRRKAQKYIVTDQTKGKVNDIIFYDWDLNHWCDHVGIISAVSKTSYTVIEGNKNKRVETRVISKKSKLIADIVRV